MCKKLLYFLIFLISSVTITGQNIQLSDSSKVSLLTNTPWDKEVYALFGHTAIRINDPSVFLDVVFNYGIFDFDSPNFMYRFVKGETDYMVAGYSFSQYLSGYKNRGIGITEQVLNLTLDEKQRILDALVTNALPENRVYRYNYFYDNCSTRPRDIIEKNIHGTIQYTATNKLQTYRDLVHECVSGQPWVRFGIDLVIGADADKVISDHQKDFIPSYLLHSYKSATIKQGENIRRLVSEENLLLSQDSAGTFVSPSFNTPLWYGLIFLLFTIVFSYISYKKNWMIASKIFDFILFFVAGTAGFIIFFLMYFSVHPCTNPNWNLVWLNPVQIIAAILFLIKFRSKYVYYYHFINFAILIVFLLAWFLIPQYLEIAFIPYILALCIRSGTNVLNYRKNNNH